MSTLLGILTAICLMVVAVNAATELGAWRARREWRREARVAASRGCPWRGTDRCTCDDAEERR